MAGRADSHRVDSHTRSAAAVAHSPTLRVLVSVERERERKHAGVTSVVNFEARSGAPLGVKSESL